MLFSKQSLIMLIAIDGPVAVGKSTVGKLIAKRLGFPFLDTGLMYRALTWKVLGENIDPSDEEEIGKLLNNIEIDIELSRQNTRLKLKIDEKELVGELRSPDVEKAVSLVSRLSVVREFMVHQQQKVAKSLPNLVMAGRDIGTVVLPEAEHKYFLVASPGIRAERRLKELEEKGEHIDFSSLFRQIKERDEIDTKRSISPLQAADDAIIVNTDNLSAEQVTEKILAYINQ